MDNLSYSAMTRFLKCRKSYELRYKYNLEPVRSSDALSFGKLIHSCLEALYSNKPYLGIIQESYPEYGHLRALSEAMMVGYINLYGKEDKDRNIIKTEQDFECDIINPLTGRKSRKFKLHGYIDMVEKRDDGIWLWEHKTAASINAGYIERIWHDLQIMVYPLAYEMMFGVKPTGIVYNILQKAKLRQGKNEKIEDFYERLKQRYLADNDMFRRVEILTDELSINEVRKEIWQITQDIGKCENFYKSRSQCYVFGECEFFKICNSGDNPLVIQNYYKERENEITNEENREDEKSF